MRVKCGYALLLVGVLLQLASGMALMWIGIELIVMGVVITAADVVRIRRRRHGR